MDSTLLQQKINDWKRVNEYFSQSSVASQLASDEKQAVVFLLEYWKNNEFNPSACEPKIELLKACDKLHSANREIIEKSKTLRGLAQTFYTKDAETFNQFRVALGWKPQTKAPTPVPTSGSQNDDSLMMIRIEKWAKAYQYLKRDDIIPLMDTDELTAIEILGDMWRRPKYNSAMKEEAAEMVKVLVASHKLHSANREIIEHSKNICSVARNVYENEEAFKAFKTAITKYYKDNRPPERIPTPTPTPTPTPKKKPTPIPQRRDTTIIIKDAVFANASENGEFINGWGKTLYTDTQFIKPKLILSSEYYGSEEITVLVKYSDGESDTLKYTVDFAGAGEYPIPGWGSKSGRAFSSYSYVDYTFMQGSKVLYNTRVSIKPNPNAPKAPVISDIKFGATDYNGNIKVPFGSPLPRGIQYLTPRIVVSNNFRGIVTLEMVFQHEGGSTDRTTTEVRIDGAGEYTLVGWGNNDGTVYGQNENLRFTLNHNGKQLYTTVVKIGSGGNGNNHTPTPRRQISSSESGWDRFNDSISSIGEWFEEKGEIIQGILVFLIIAIYAIVVIAAWINEGFWSALLAGIIGAVIGGIAVYAIAIVSSIVLWLLQLIFRNAWTFIITMVLVLVFFILPMISFSSDDYDYNEYSYVEPQTSDTYYCTANSLNIRQAPSTTATSIGSLSLNERVEVLEIVGDFAKINYKGHIGYVSTKYISRY